MSPSTHPDPATLRQTILELLAARAPEASICPSDAARVVGGTGWRTLMTPVREAAADLADAGRLVVTQGPHEVDIRTARGPVRLRRPPGGRQG